MSADDELELDRFSYSYEDSDNVMVLRITDKLYPECLSMMFCAIGRSDPWPQNFIYPKEDPTEDELLRRDDGFQYHLDKLGYAS